ncbi:hypothetical protein [Paraglaciecola sp. L3A3]|uniref:hypothetical protein n=1 Tax=Paraglaciecola sp. L3A3 TaxID=2686358 RepID=UPI00131CFE54|nr:hypothetical protein [Paraglaciecola sp. L3A3]
MSIDKESVNSIEKEIVALKAIFELPLTRCELEVLKGIKDMPFYRVMSLRRNNTFELNLVSEELYGIKEDTVSSDDFHEAFLSNSP